MTYNVIGGTLNLAQSNPFVWNSLPANIRSVSVSLQTLPED